LSNYFLTPLALILPLRRTQPEYSVDYKNLSITQLKVFQSIRDLKHN